MRGDLNKIAMLQIIKNAAVVFETEYKFSAGRKFRFDFAILQPIKIGIEYEGIISGKSRHTSIIGYSTDCEKYNLAAVEGWIVLRYTAINFFQPFR